MGSPSLSFVSSEKNTSYASFLLLLLLLLEQRREEDERVDFE